MNVAVGVGKGNARKEGNGLDLHGDVGFVVAISKSMSRSERVFEGSKNEWAAP